MCAASGSLLRPRALRRASAAASSALLAVGLLAAGPAASPAAGEDRVERADTLMLRPETDSGVRASDVALNPRMRRVANGFRTPRMHTGRFRMLGLTWSAGEARLSVRTRSGGTWSPWQAAEPLPDGPGAEEGRGTRRGTELTWIGPADAVQVHSRSGPPRGLRMTLIDPLDVGGIGSSKHTEDTQDLQDQGGAAQQRPTRAPVPDLNRRRAWGADESLRSGRPSYNRTIQQMHVHHTVNSNAYQRGDVAGMIRGMYRYHTRSLGWSDIGYNFLVDKFGRIWIGRAGGAGKPVRGAHTLGFNKTSFGVAVIGNFENGKPGKKAYTALVQLAAWKLDKYKRNPAGQVRVYSHGSDRYARGAKPRLPVIDGHRDTNHTACPGAHLYQKIPNIRRRAAKRADRFNP